MAAANVIPFPKRWHSPGYIRAADYHRRVHQPQTAPARVTVRFLGTPARQLPLPLPEDSTLDQRIAAAKATIANYEHLAAHSRPVSSSLYLRFARGWEQRLAGLLAEKRALAHQPDLLPGS